MTHSFQNICPLSLPDPVTKIQNQHHQILNLVITSSGNSPNPASFSSTPTSLSFPPSFNCPSISSITPNWAPNLFFLSSFSSLPRISPYQTLNSWMASLRRSVLNILSMICPAILSKSLSWMFCTSTFSLEEMLSITLVTSSLNLISQSLGMVLDSRRALNCCQNSASTSRDCIIDYNSGTNSTVQIIKDQKHTLLYLYNMSVIARSLAQFRGFLLRPSYSFAILKLFEPPKTREQLSPIFKLPERHPGHSLHKTKPRHQSVKFSPHTKVMPHKLHNHNSLVKRIKIVGPRHARKFKFLHTGKRHLNRNKSRSNLMRKRKVRYISKADTERVRKMIPSFKRRAFKFFH